jgi:hypothetical protein
MLPKTAFVEICFLLRLPMQPIFKEKSIYPDFVHIWLARRPN